MDIPAEQPPMPLDEYGAVKFVGDGGLTIMAIGSYGDWMRRAPIDYSMIRLAADTIARDDHAQYSVVKELGSDTTVEFIKALIQIKDRYAATLEILEAATARNLAAMSRFLTTDT